MVLYAMTQEMCNKAVHRCFFALASILDYCKSQEICDLVIFLNHF